VDGTVDPLRDIETIHVELVFADLDAAERRLDKWTKAAKGNDKDAIRQRDFAKLLVDHLLSGKPARAGSWGDEGHELLRDSQMITGKPALYVCNVDEAGLREDNHHVRAVKKKAEEERASVVVLCAKVEAEIAELEDAADRIAFLADLGLEEPGLATLARATYDLLGLQTFFTAGPKEIRAWTIHHGWTAPKAAGVIHTDFERGFIRAEVYGIDDLLELGTEAAMKAAGRLRVEGKEYVVRDGDVMHFRFNV
jgi:GTP-binding protein YchF